VLAVGKRDIETILSEACRYVNWSLRRFAEQTHKADQEFIRSPKFLEGVDDTGLAVCATFGQPVALGRTDMQLTFSPSNTSFHGRTSTCCIDLRCSCLVISQDSDGVRVPEATHVAEMGR
jgi:hypothetical protein